MLPNVTRARICSLTKCIVEDVFKTAVLKTLQYLQKISATESTVNYVAVCRAAIFLNEVLRQIYFLGIYEIFNFTNISNLHC